MKIFLSYASNDQNEYKVEEIVDFLEFQDDIECVYYWERDTKGGQTFDEYMTSTFILKDRVKDKEEKGEQVILPVLMQEFSLD